MSAPLKAPGGRPPPASTTASARLAEATAPAPVRPPPSPPPPTATIAEPVDGHRYSGPAVRETAARPSPTAGIEKKLERDPGFGSGLLEGIAAGDRTPADVLATMGDLFNDKKRAQLGAAVARLHAALEATPKASQDELLAAIDLRFGPGVTNALVNFADDPSFHAGHLAGRVAAAGRLGRRTQIAQVTNEIGAFLDERASRSQAAAEAKRPRPTKTGGDSQYELAGRALRPDGRISGQRFSGAHRAAEIARAEAAGLKVDTNADALLARQGVSAAFDPAEGKIYVRSDATRLEWFHELTHALQWKELGPEAYQEQSRFQKELHVFRAVRDHSADFNAYEFEAAKNYIRRLAEVSGHTLPADAREW